MRFQDRADAGGGSLVGSRHLRGADVVVVGLPRGGVPVAAEVARELGAPLDVIVVRKLGVPIQPELAMGAIGEGGVRVINDDVVRAAASRTASSPWSKQSNEPSWPDAHFGFEESGPASRSRARSWSSSTMASRQDRPHEPRAPS